MAKKVIKSNQINQASDLITTPEQTRAGFITLALEKNYLAVPYIEEAKALKLLANKIKKPLDLLYEKDIRVGLLSASGLSDKSLKFLTEEDKIIAIKGLIKEFLEPAGSDFINELVYRYLLTKGDALGGKARNLAGELGERKFIRSMLSLFKLSGIKCKWKDSENNLWYPVTDYDSGLEKRIKGFYWLKNKRSRLLLMNVTVPIVKKNVDLCILDGIPDFENHSNNQIINMSEKYLALGELKGGLDPAGADEHWKTANSALSRIRIGFSEEHLYPKTFFIGAAIEKSMANEIFNQLQNNILNNAANLTNDDQLTNVCNWIINL